MESEYKVKAGAYEGPLEALLDLIEKRKLLINEISLAQIADDYLTHIKSLVDLPLRDTAQFILVASTLVLIKSRSLLPTLVLTNEEEHSIHDLERRLKLYEQYRVLAGGLKERFGKEFLFARRDVGMREPVFAPDTETTVPSLLAAVRGAIARFPKVEVLPKVIVKRIKSIEEVMDNLRHRVASALKMSFRDFVGGEKEKREVIVGFLALLELTKQGVIDVIQHAKFEDISIEAQDVGVPKYL